MNEKIKPVHIIAVLLFDKSVGFSIIIMARTIGITIYSYTRAQCQSKVKDSRN